MGRRKKEILEPSRESREYALDAAQNYPEMRQYCDDFEMTHPSLFRKGKVSIAAFEDMDCFSQDTFVMPDLSACDAAKMDDYLADREKVYLFEYSLERMDDPIRAVAESLFIGKLTWEEVMRKHCASRMTISRYRKEALRQIAVIVDSYMDWKVKSLFV